MTFVELIGVWIASSLGAALVLFGLGEAWRWRDTRRERRAEQRLRRLARDARRTGRELAARQERAAAAALARPHGRRVVVQLADERELRRGGCRSGERPVIG